MPEGPEIRLAADRVAKVLVGNEITDAYFAPPRLRRFARKLKGSVVTSIDTRGKAMLTRFDSGLTLYSHNQLYGVWYTATRENPPETGRSLRVALHTRSHSALLYSASDIEMLSDRQIEEHPFLNRIGPDILDDLITASDVAARLNDAVFSGRSVGSLYLDQSFMAGVGNYLRSEILFTARVHPTNKPAALDRAARNRLARATLSVSRRSYKTQGVTVTRALAKALRGQGLSFQQHRFWVFRREGLPCHICGTPIEKFTLSSRGLYYCPTCQVRCGPV